MNLGKHLKKISSSFIGYLSLLVRRDYTTKYRGADVAIDNHLRFIVVERIFGIDLRKEEGLSIDQKMLEQIKSKITPETEKQIEAEIAGFAPFKTAILELSHNKKLSSRPSLTLLLRKRAELWRKFSTARKFFSDVNAYKAEITYSSLTKTLALISPALLLGGLLRQYIFAKAFGFDLGLVFTIGDYISSSLTTITYSILPLITMAASGYWGFHEETRLDPRQRKWLKREETIATRFVYIVVIVGTIANYFIDRKTFYTLLPLSIIVLSIIFLPAIAKRYFKNGLAVFVASFFAITFFGNIASNTMLNVYSIRNDPESTKYIIANSEIPASLDNLVLVTSGSFYKVFWDKAGRQTVLVKSDLLIGVIEKAEKP